LIRLRKTNGDYIQLPPEFRFIELVDMDGKVGIVFFQDGQQTCTFTDKTPEAKNYKKLFPKVEFVPLQEYKDDGEGTLSKVVKK
jgi:hypothetical protein